MGLEGTDGKSKGWGEMVPLDVLAYMVSSGSQPGYQAIAFDSSQHGGKGEVKQFFPQGLDGTGANLE